VKPLTAWQKILKFFGLYKPETSAPRPAKKAARPRKENVRDASGRSSGGDRSRDDGERSRDDGERGRDRGEKTSGGGGKTARARQKPRPTPDSSTVEGTRLYIGNLSYDASEHDLEDLLKGVGSVRNIDIVYNRNTHRSKGYGFVEMGRVDEARRAVEVLHDQPFMGRTLIVNSAKSKGPVDDDGDEAPQESPPASIPVTEE
jgi:RNA recognition motif-containing protein